MTPHAKEHTRSFCLSGLIALIVALFGIAGLSNPVRAATFTLEELFDPAQTNQFQIGSVVFSNFMEVSGSNVDPASVVIETVENSSLLGFTTNGFFGAGARLRYDFDVIELNPDRFFETGVLYLKETVISLDGPFDINITARECIIGAPGTCDTPLNPRPDMFVQLTDQITNVIDADLFDPVQGAQDPFRVRTQLEAITMAEGQFSVRSYATVFTTAVPEPGTALLLGFGLAGLAVRRRRA